MPKLMEASAAVNSVVQSGYSMFLNLGEVYEVRIHCVRAHVHRLVLLEHLSSQLTHLEQMCSIGCSWELATKIF